ncbi:MAG: cellulase family glycosylhydrolase [Bacteroidia bacterium]|nr:cellulase family glycosylhydrolase [Bacteroidia bacterium]
MKKISQLLTYLFVSAGLFAQPISLHPENPHYFLFRGKAIAIVSSSEHYGAVINPAFDYLLYLNTLQKDGMNYTRLFTGSYFEKEGSFGIEKNTLAPAAGKALIPWKRSNEPGAVCGGNKFNLDQWDENYFARLKSFVSEAGKHGIIVEITLFSSIYDYWDIQVWNKKNNVTLKEDLLKENIQTLNNGSAKDYQIDMVRKIVKELNEFDNVIYEIQNEPWADHSISMELNSEFLTNADFKLDGHEWQKRIEVADQPSLEWQKKIAATIVEEEKKLKNRHLIAQNYSNFYYPVPEADQNVSILNFHYAYPIAVEKNYGLGIVIGFDESGFSGTADVTYRKQAWKFILSGGGLFNNLDYSFAVGNEDGKAVNKAPGGGSTELRKQLKVLSDFFHSFDFVRMRPDNEAAVMASGSFARVFSEKGKQYAIYFNNGPNCNLKLNLPEGNYKTDWINTLNGSVMKSEKVKHPGGEFTLISPEFSEDIALKIIRQ